MSPDMQVNIFDAGPLTSISKNYVANKLLDSNEYFQGQNTNNMSATKLQASASLERLSKRNFSKSLLS